MPEPYSKNIKDFKKELEKDILIDKTTEPYYTKDQVIRIVSETTSPLAQQISELTNEIHELTLMSR